jgi:hypothetical protein
MFIDITTANEDLEFPYYDKNKRIWIVEEQIYPENRGYKKHTFKNKFEAIAFYKWGLHNPQDFNKNPIDLENESIYN